MKMWESLQKNPQIQLNPQSYINNLIAGAGASAAVGAATAGVRVAATGVGDADAGDGAGVGPGVGAAADGLSTLKLITFRQLILR